MRRSLWLRQPVKAIEFHGCPVHGREHVLQRRAKLANVHAFEPALHGFENFRWQFVSRPAVRADAALTPSPTARAADARINDLHTRVLTGWAKPVPSHSHPSNSQESQKRRFMRVA